MIYGIYERHVAEHGTVETVQIDCGLALVTATRKIQLITTRDFIVIASSDKARTGTD